MMTRVIKATAQEYNTLNRIRWIGYIHVTHLVSNFITLSQSLCRSGKEPHIWTFEYEIDVFLKTMHKRNIKVKL